TEKGAFEFFGLLLREEAPNRWDLVLAAPWLKPHNLKSLEFIADHLRSILKLEEMVMLSRIVILGPDSPVLDPLLEEFHVEHGLVQARHVEFAGMGFRHVYVITAKRLRVPEGEKAR